MSAIHNIEAQLKNMNHLNKTTIAMLSKVNRIQTIQQEN
jgi:hypothetical protein